MLYASCVVSWLPNALTAARLVAVVPFAILLAEADDGVSTGAAVIFAAASFTDFLDGYLARRYHVQSRFGRLADPLADRLLIDVALVLLIWHDRLAWWLAVPVLLRDVLLGIVFKLRNEATTVQVNFTGKTATAVIMASLTLLMLTTADWPQILFGIGLGLAVAAGVMYLRSPEGGLESRPS
jgi:CDP-diacylglycerol--glycerol-3-phosphate 3-phosphatidyltransferase